MYRKRLKDMAAVFIIICLLPYVITVLCSGNTTMKNSTKEVSGQVVVIKEEGRTEEMGLDEYLAGVLATQIPAEYHLEAIKAQAVLTRTGYMLHGQGKKAMTVENGGQSFLTVEQMQELWGEKFDENYQKYRRAIKDTQGKVLSRDGKMLEPYFHAASSGSTRSGKDVLGEGYEYLKSVSCEKDLHMDNYVTIKTFTREELSDIFKQQYEESDWKEKAFTDVIKIKKRDDAGYVSEVEVGSRAVTGETFRTQFHLPSSSFQIKLWKDGIQVICKGIGHGFGMSLYTADKLAKSGKNYEEILNYFFICE